jgi:hypothetical protein
MGRTNRDSSKKSNTGLIIGVVVVIVIIAIAFFALGHSSSSNGGGGLLSTQSTSTIPVVYTTNLYSQGQVFPLSTGGSNAESFSIPTGSWNMNISGSYQATQNTEAYILNSEQYGAFTQSKDHITNYTWYSGANGGDTINGVNLVAGNTYYMVFYTGAIFSDTVTVVNPIVVHYTH